MAHDTEAGINIILEKLGTEGAKWVLRVDHDDSSATLALYKSESDARTDEIPLMQCNLVVDDEDVAHATFSDPRHTNGGEILFLDSFPSKTSGALAAHVRGALSVYMFPDANFAVLEERGADPRVVRVPEFDPTWCIQATPLVESRPIS